MHTPLIRIIKSHVSDAWSRGFDYENFVEFRSKLFPTVKNCNITKEDYDVACKLLTDEMNSYYESNPVKV